MGLNYKSGGIAAFVLFVLCFSIAVSAQNSYLRAYVPDYIIPNSTVFVTGETIESGSAASLNVTVRVTNTTNSSIYVNSSNTNGTTGAFNMSIFLPNFEGEFTVSVNSNSSTLIEKNLTTNTSYFQDASFEFIGNQPPFAPGDSITIKTTAKYENGSALGSGYSIAMGIYSGNGKIAGPGNWGAEQANQTIADGTTTHSFTIASTAEPGDYVADMYGKHLVFTIKKYSVAGLTLDNESQSSAFFSPGSVVDIRTKVKNASNDPQTGATVDAVIVYPNGTEESVSLTSTSLGIYDYNLTLPSTTTGTYTVRINSTIGSVTEETQSTFTVQDVRLSLERSSLLEGGMMMFDFWGGDKVISPGSNASFDIKAFDLSTGEFLPARTDAASGGKKGVNCSSANITDVTQMATGANVTGSVLGNETTTATSLKFMGGSLCTITFRTPATAGIYRVTVNVTVNSSTNYNMKSVTGYFTTQNYKLKVIPVTRMGRDKFHVLLRPGRNASFKLEVRNISAKSTLTTPNITDVEVTALTSMGEFSFGGASDTLGIEYKYDSSKKKITAFIPENLTGPTLIKVQAIYQVSGTENETLTGDGFFFAKYVMGFVGPMFGGMMGGEGEGEMEEGGMGGPGGGPMGMGGTAMDCSGTMQFQGFVMDVETEQPQESVVIKKGTIREEFTGRDVSACFTVSQPTGGAVKSDSNGRVSLNLTFSLGTGCPYATASQLSGFYFSLWDAKWQNYTDSLPGGFECKNFNFWPYMSNWDVGPNSTVNFTIQNVVYMSNTSKYVKNGTVNLTRLINFDPSRGPIVIDISNATGVTFDDVTTVSYALEPRNFTTLVSNNNNQWYSGFYDCLIQVCDNNNTNNDSDDTCDTAFGGFAVFPFQAYIMSQDVWNTSAYTWMPGDTKTIEIWSERLIGENITIKRMDFMTGEQVDITLIHNLTLVYQEGFNITVNFTLPSNLEKGEGMVMFELTDNRSDKVTVDIFAQIKTYDVISPQAPWPGDQSIQQKRIRIEGREAQVNTTINITNPENWTGINIASYTPNYPPYTESVTDEGPFTFPNATSSTPYYLNTTYYPVVSGSEQIFNGSSLLIRDVNYTVIDYSLGQFNITNWNNSLSDIETVYINYSDTEYENLTKDLLSWNLSYIKQAHDIESAGGPRTIENQNDAEGWGEYCIFENIFNASEQILVINNGTPGTGGSTFTHIFIKVNGTNGTDPSIPGASLRGPYVPGNYIGGGLYLRDFEYCIPFIFSSSESDYTTLVGQNQKSNYWSKEWSWGGRHRKDSNFTIPFYIEWVNGSKDEGANVTITEIGGMNFDKKGFTAPLSAGDFVVNDNTTDAQGIAQVTLNISQSGMYRAFWWVNSSTGIEETAGFDNGIILQVSAFECFGQWESDTGSGMEGVMTTPDGALIGEVRASYFNMSSIANANVSLYYMYFTDWGPPQTEDLTTGVGGDLIYPHNGSPMTGTPQTNSQGILNVTINPSENWPTSSYGACVEVQGTVTAELYPNSPERFFMGRVCTYPTG